MEVNTRTTATHDSRICKDLWSRGPWASWENTFDSPAPLISIDLLYKNLFVFTFHRRNSQLETKVQLSRLTLFNL